MLIYEGTKTDSMQSIESETIAYEIEQKILSSMHRHTSINEFRAWENSLDAMYKVLNDQDIPCDAGIAIEYGYPIRKITIDNSYNLNDTIYGYVIGNMTVPIP